MVDFDSQVVQEDENMPLTPPGPEMRKILEGGGEEEEEKEEIDMGEATDNLKEVEPDDEEEVINEVEKEEEEEVIMDQDSNDDDNNDDTAQEIPAVLSTSSDHIVYEDDAPEEVNVSSGWESSEGESSSETESEEEDVAPYVAAAVGTTAATAAAVASANEEEPYDVEMDSNNPTTETETAGDNPPDSSPEDDFVIEETGEDFNLEESLNEVIPPQDNYDDDEERQLAAAAAGAATAATATKAADVANTPNDYDEEERQPRKSSSSCCKRHKCLTLFIILMILFVIAAVVLIILFLLGPLKHPVSQEPIDKEGTTPPNLCNVVDLGSFYKTDCETCRHTVAMDGETGLIARGGEGGSIQFIVEDGTYIPGQTLPFIDHEVSALSGNYAALGDVGTVYVYEQDPTGVWSNVWNKTQVTMGAKFGTAIALYGDKLVVGAPGEVNGNSTGSVYVYGRDADGNWVEEAKLYQTSVPTGSFGSGVALHGDTLVVADGAFPGAAYVYQHDITTNSWNQPIGGTLSGGDCRPVSFSGQVGGNSYTKTFGMSVGVANNEGVMVGCPSEEGYKGTVNYYTPSKDGSGYELRQKITAFNEKALPALGKIVVDNVLLLVTTAEESVYVYELGAADGGGYWDWEEAAMIAAPGGANDAALSGEQFFLSYGGNTRSYILEC